MLLWWLHDSARLREQTRALFLDPDSELLWSACSTWELAIKTQLGRLRIDAPLEAFVGRVLAEQHLVSLPVQQHHAARIADLPPIHRDPFDRMLVAQAQVEGLSLVSRDPAVRQYQVTVLWAPEAQAPRAPYRVRRKPRRR